jgi:hypothetical protein
MPNSAAGVNMGGAGAAILNDHNVLLVNPANLGAINKTAFSSMLTFDFLRIAQDSHHSNHISVAPRQIAFAFPLGKIGTVGFSLSKETDAGVEFRTSPVRIDNSDFVGTLSYHGTGGLAGWRFGWGYGIGKWIYLGMAYERLYFERNNTKIIDLSSYDAVTTRDSTRMHFTANAIHGGIIVPVANATVGIAGRYVFEDDIIYDRAQYRETEAAPLAGTDTAANSKVKLPPYIVFGGSYQLSSRWLAGADIGMEKWNSYSSNYLLPGASEDLAMRFGVGVRFIPAPDLLAPKYWETIHYRLGFKYMELPSEKSSEFAFSIGSGFPVKGGGLLDLAVSFGRRSDERFTDYTEDFVQIAIGINGGRKWMKASPGNY